MCEKLKFEKLAYEGEVGRIMREQILHDMCEEYVLVGEERTAHSKYFPKYANDIENFEVRNDDVFVASYPKAGTTWTQEMVWLIANDLDFKRAAQSLMFRFPFLEGSTIMCVEKFGKRFDVADTMLFKNSIKFVEELEGARFIKTHLPFSLLPDDIKYGSKSPKIIYVTRNPKDVCVFYCHHGNLLQGWRTNVEDFSKVFLDDKAMFGSYWKHVLGYWNQRNAPNYLIISFEEMKRDLPAVIEKVAKHLDKELIPSQIQQLAEHLSFDSMKKNESVNGRRTVEHMKKLNYSFEKDGNFFRSGTVGKYKDEMSPDTIERFDEWTRRNIEGSGYENRHDSFLQL